MKQQAIFPVQAMTEAPDSAIKIEGQKVVFDKKVSLLPVDVKNDDLVKIKAGNGRTYRQHEAGRK